MACRVPREMVWRTLWQGRLSHIPDAGELRVSSLEPGWRHGQEQEQGNTGALAGSEKQCSPKQEHEP